MARLRFNHYVNLTPNANPRTIVQIITAANHRAVLHALEVIPFGATAAEIAVAIDLVWQTTAGTMEAAAAACTQKQLPAQAETVQTTFLQWGTQGTEPTGTDFRDELAVHNQSPRLWLPGDGQGIEIPGDKRLGIRYKSDTFHAIRLVLKMEE